MPSTKRPRLRLMCGMAGSGKSTYARGLEAQGWRRLSIDGELWRAGHRTLPVPPGVAAAIRARQRDELQAALGAGRDVVVDYSFWARADRDAYRELGRECDAVVDVVHLDVPEPELRRRLAERDGSHADGFVVDDATLTGYLAGFEWPGPDETDVVVLRPLEGAPEADACFAHPRLAAIYDEGDADRSDLEVYVALVDELGVRSVLDVGCGTGSLAVLLAERGVDVVGVDPADASLAVARAKPHADRMRWVHGDATTVAGHPDVRVDLAIMTGNVAQVFVTDDDWHATLRAARAVLAPGGRLAFETRDPSYEGWREWTHEQTHTVVETTTEGAVECWCDLLEVDLPRVTFRWSYVFGDGDRLTSDSTLRFRSRDEVEASLEACGFVVDEVRGAPDRPGRELVVIASAR